MQILELEQKYSELKSDLGGQQSKRTKLLKISEYFGFALSVPLTNANLIEPFIIDLIPDFIKYSSDLEIRGLNPQKIELLKDQLIQLKNLNLNGIESLECDRVIQSLENKIQVMNNWLISVKALEHKPKIYFPLLEKYGDDLGSGYLETVNVVIERGEQKFNISPSGLENDEQLEKQIQLCFEKALEYCSRYIRKIKKTHTVYIHFENRLGILTGNSLGAALALFFIEALLKHYNSQTILNVNKTIAITGGIDHDSRIIATSKTIIGAKIETVFYSDVEIMCVPKIDEMWAEEKLKELQIEYPKRNLKIIGLTDLNDLLDRRQIVDIRKQKLIIRGGKFVRKNWISAVATILLALFFAYLFVIDFDNNPAILTTDGTTLFVKNRNGKILWTKFVDIVKSDINSENPYSRDARIIDINGDGKNEVLLTREIDKKINGVKDYSLLSCYDKNGEVIWKYSFRDNVESKREILNNDYSIYIIDTLSIDGITNLFLRSSNINSFASAIFKIDLHTSKRLPGTFWCSGHIADVILKDIDSDGKAEVLGMGYDNGYEDAVFFVFEIDTLTLARPTTNEYLLDNFLSSEMKTYIRLPKTDYEKFAKVRTPTLTSGTLRDDIKNKKYKFAIFNPFNRQNELFGYEIDHNLNDIDITITSGFRVARDSLVAHEILNPPYTDTDAYKNIIISNIQYWKDGKWINRKELIKNE